MSKRRYSTLKGRALPGLGRGRSASGPGLWSSFPLARSIVPLRKARNHFATWQSSLETPTSKTAYERRTNVCSKNEELGEGGFSLPGYCTTSPEANRGATRVILIFT